MDPKGGGLVKEAGLPAAARIELDKARHSRCYAAMTAAFEMSKPLSEKYRALIQGYAMRDAQKGDAFKKLLATLDQKEIELECFEVRQDPPPPACSRPLVQPCGRSLPPGEIASRSACLLCPRSRRLAVWRGKGADADGRESAALRSGRPAATSPTPLGMWVCCARPGSGVPWLVLLLSGRPACLGLP